MPTSISAVYFDSSYSNHSVTTPSTSSDLQLAELHFVNGYTGTVTLASDLSVAKLELASASATLDQPNATYGSDVTVTSAMHWTGGTLNGTSHLASLTITGGTTWATFAPASGGTVNLGSSINLNSDAVLTLLEGTLQATNDTLQFNINAGGMNVDPGASANMVFSSANVTFRGQINIVGEQSWFKVFSGTVDSSMPLKNTGGSLILLPDTLSTFKGEVDGTAGGPSVQQTAGVMYLYRGSILEVSNAEFGLIMSGGMLSIQLDQGSGDIEIVGNVKITGGDIISGSNSSGDTHLYGTLKVEGDVTWTGGTYRPFVSSDSDEVSDVWHVTGTFTIGGTAAIAPGAVDGENNPVDPPQNMAWDSLLSDSGITAAAGTPSVLTGWALDKVNNFRWRVKGA